MLMIINRAQDAGWDPLLPSIVYAHPLSGWRHNLPTSEESSRLSFSNRAQVLPVADMAGRCLPSMAWGVGVGVGAVAFRNGHFLALPLTWFSHRPPSSLLLPPHFAAVFRPWQHLERLVSGRGWNGVLLTRTRLWARPSIPKRWFSGFNPIRSSPPSWSVCILLAKRSLWPSRCFVPCRIEMCSSWMPWSEGIRRIAYTSRRWIFSFGWVEM